MATKQKEINYPKLYLEEIQSGKQVADIKIKSVYTRECGWMDSPPKDFPYYFDEDAGNRPIEFIETFCKQSQGAMGGKPLNLQLFQKAKIQLAFGWIEKETGLRRIREVIDIRAKKCGKSTETAGIALYMTVGDNENGAKNYCTANKKEQSDLIFDECVAMRTQSPDIKLITKKRQSDIYCPYTFSLLKSLAADTSTMDGLNVHFFCQDEFHEAKTDALYDIMKRGQSGRKQPMAWLISTNGYLRELFFDDTYERCSHVAMWEDGYHDYRMLPIIYELDSRDEWINPLMWEKANPGLGIIKDLSALVDSVEEAKRNPKTLPKLLVKDFNIPENSSEA